MAILGMEGFDHFTTGSSVAVEITETEDYSYIGLGLGISSTVTPFSEGKSIDIIDESRELRFYNSVYGDQAASFHTAYISFHYYAETNAATRFLCGIIGAGGYQATVRHNTNGTIAAYRGEGGTLVGSASTLTVPFDQWVWIDVKFNIADSGNVTVNVNGVEYLNVNGDFLNNTTTPILTTVYITGVNSGHTYYDNVVWQDKDGSLLGECKIDTFMPTGDSGTPDWTAAGTPGGTGNYAYIDEIPVTDTDYVFSGTTTDVDLYDYDNMSADHTVLAVGIKTRAQLDTAGTGEFKNRTYYSGTEQSGAAKALTAASWSWYTDVFEVYNSGTGAYTKTIFDGSQFGIEVTG